MQEPLVGKLLIASTCIDNPIYSRGVCLVVHDDESRTIGVMLNRPMQPSPEMLLSMISPPSEPEVAEDDFDLDLADEDVQFNEEPNPEIESSHTPFTMHVNRVGTNQPSPADEETVIRASGSLGLVHFGGPLSGPVVAVHGSSELAEVETGKGIYVAAQKQHLEDLVRHKPSPYRLIVGHLGWGPDQLWAEIQAGVWHLVPATADIVFDNDSDMWASLVRRATAHSMARWIGTPDVPAAHRLN